MLDPQVFRVILFREICRTFWTWDLAGESTSLVSDLIVYSLAPLPAQ